MFNLIQALSADGVISLAVQAGLRLGGPQLCKPAGGLDLERLGKRNRPLPCAASPLP